MPSLLASISRVFSSMFDISRETTQLRRRCRPPIRSSSTVCDSPAPPRRPSGPWCCSLCTRCLHDYSVEHPVNKAVIKWTTHAQTYTTWSHHERLTNKKRSLRSRPSTRVIALSSVGSPPPITPGNNLNWAQQQNNNMHFYEDSRLWCGLQILTAGRHHCR